MTEWLINICKNLEVGKHLLNINYLRGGEAEAQFPKEHRSDEHHQKQNEKHCSQTEQTNPHYHAQSDTQQAQRVSPDNKSCTLHEYIMREKPSLYHK